MAQPSRDDSILHTGFSSAISRKLEHEQQQRQRDRDIERSKLTASAEMVLEKIEQRRRDVTNFDKVVLNLESEADLRAQMMAIKLHLDFLDELKRYLKQPLRAMAKAEAERDKTGLWADKVEP